MNIGTHINEALSNLTASKLRSFLAILGILVGTASVVALISSGQLATQAALQEFKVLGTDLMSLSLFADAPQAKPGSAKEFDLNEALGLKPLSPAIREVAPYTTLYVPIIFHGQKINGSIIGATGALKPTIKINLAQGRFISYLDGYQSFCVIGQGLAQDLERQGLMNPIGSQIQLGDAYFTIVGVSAKWPENSFFNEDINRAVIIPLQASYLLSKYTQIRNVVLRLDPKANIDAVLNTISQYVDKAAPGMKVFPRSAKQLIQSMQSQHQIFTLLLGLIGSIALLVGGIGVMNIMLVSIAERRREIGIRLAIGAMKKDIQKMFLFEATLLSLFGGTLGVMIGIVVSYIISLFTHWGFMIFWLPPLIGFLVSAATGVFFGFYPAYRASHLDPIECLRTE